MRVQYSLEYQGICTAVLCYHVYGSVGSAPTPSPSPATASTSSSHFASSPWAPSSSSHTSVTPIAHGSRSITSVCVITSIASIVHAVCAVASISPASSTVASTSSPAASVLGSHLLDGEGDSIDGGGTLLDQLLGSLLPVEGDESKVLGFIVLALVHRSHHLGNGAKRGEVCLYVLIADSLWRKVAQVDLALLGLGLLAGDLLPLHDVGLLSGGGGQTLHILEQDEGKPSGPASVGICLQVDVLDFSEGTEVLLDVCVLRFLRKTSNKQLSDIFMNWVFSCHFGCCSISQTEI